MRACARPQEASGRRTRAKAASVAVEEAEAGAGRMQRDFAGDYAAAGARYAQLW